MSFWFLSLPRLNDMVCYIQDECKFPVSVSKGPFVHMFIGTIVLILFE